MPSCFICGHLKDYYHAMQKGGREHEHTFLPPETDRLTDLGQVTADSCRTARLLQCPQCLDYWLYRTDYEFLVSGTEDEQWLERLSPAAAETYRATLRP